MKLPLPIFITLCALWLTPARADQPLGSGLGGLLSYAREHNPEFSAMRYEADAAAQRVQPAAALPDPVLRADVMNVASLQATQIGGMGIFRSLIVIPALYAFAAVAKWSIVTG